MMVPLNPNSVFAPQPGPPVEELREDPNTLLDEVEQILKSAKEVQQNLIGRLKSQRFYLSACLSATDEALQKLGWKAAE